jgi:hypothetical protein
MKKEVGGAEVAEGSMRSRGGRKKQEEQKRKGN